MRSLFRSSTALLALAASLTLAQTAHAQRADAPGRNRTPVTVAMVDELPQPDTPFTILRRATAEPHDVILVRADADAELLTTAVQTLLQARAVGGERALADATLRLRPQTNQQARRAFPWANRVLNDLRRAEPQEVAGVGTVHAIEIWLPKRRGNGRAP